MREIERTSATRFLGTDLAAIAEDEPTDVETLTARIAAGGLLVAAEGEAIAFVMFREMETSGYIEQIDVLPSYAGLRIGAALIEAVAELARDRGWSALTLSTFKEVPFNAPYYQRLGFENIPDDALTLGLRHIRQEHVERGLDESIRTFMRRPL